MSERRDHVDAMEAAADIGAFKLVEDIRRRLDLNICSICRGHCFYESAWRLLWRSTLLHVCVGCAKNHCEMKSGVAMQASRATLVGANVIKAVKHDGQRWLA